MLVWLLGLRRADCVVQEFQESLARSPAVHEEGKDHYFGTAPPVLSVHAIRFALQCDMTVFLRLTDNVSSGLSLRELIHEFRHHTLSLVKCLLLQRKVGDFCPSH